jgi:hypothetical protein
VVAVPLDALESIPVGGYAVTIEYISKGKKLSSSVSAGFFMGNSLSNPKDRVNPFSRYESARLAHTSCW